MWLSGVVPLPERYQTCEEKVGNTDQEGKAAQGGLEIGEESVRVLARLV